MLPKRYWVHLLCCPDVLTINWCVFSSLKRPARVLAQVTSAVWRKRCNIGEYLTRQSTRSIDGPWVSTTSHQGPCFARQVKIGKISSLIRLISVRLCVCWYCYSVCTGLEVGTILASASDFPAFLWKDEKMIQTDPFEGFLQGEILVKVSTVGSFLPRN